MKRNPAKVREPVVQVFAAPAFGRAGAFGVHSWIVAKRTGAPAFTHYDVVAWSGSPYIQVDYLDPEALWYGSMPVLLAERRGEGVEALIGRIEEAVRHYPYADTYRTWPGPNSNTFVAHVAREVPELRLDLPANAGGKKKREESEKGAWPLFPASFSCFFLMRKRVAGGGVVLPKKRVTLYLDASLVERFKEMAGDRGYQTLINETLKTSLHRADIETTIRKVIREELKGRKAA